MKELDNALGFFHACESAEGWDGCHKYVAEGASFHSAAETYNGMDAVQDYCEQIATVFTTIFTGTYELDASAYDPNTRKVFIYGTSYARHTGEGGPVAPTNRQASVPFVYVMTMDEDAKLSHLEKVFDGDSSGRQLGWPKSS